MPQPYIGEIRMFAGIVAPADWMFCEGQILPIAEYEPLFQLIGDDYGGDGSSTFALPDLRGRLPVHWDRGPGLSFREVGEFGGAEAVALTEAQLPTHTHLLQASTVAATTAQPAGNTWAVGEVNTYAAEPASVAMNPSVVAPAGGGQPHTNLQPYLCVNFIISLLGIFPQRP